MTINLQVPYVLLSGGEIVSFWRRTPFFGNCVFIS